MINTRLTRKAMQIAYLAHKNQVDKAGVPYIYHPVHVAEAMTTEETCIVALLHDVVEDSSFTLDYLAQFFPSSIIVAIDAITRKKDMDYMDYIKIVRKNQLAKIVKLKDMEHNADLTRLDEITPKDLKRVEKYKKALEILKQ